MRRKPTPFEVILWRHLSNGQFSGYKFRRQHVIVPFIVDFFCPSKSLAIEIDGQTHKNEKDRARDAQLQKYGVSTLHFTNADVATNIDGVLTAIKMTLNSLQDRWIRQPHPNPSPEGEGL